MSKHAQVLLEDRAHLQLEAAQSLPQYREHNQIEFQQALLGDRVHLQPAAAQVLL